MSKVGQMLRFAHARDAALLLAAGFALIGAPQEVFAQASAAKPRGASSALGGLGGDSKEPIKIDADKLDVVDKENKAVFSGNVVAVQGETTVRCTVMTVLYEGRGGPGGTCCAGREEVGRLQVRKAAARAGRPQCPGAPGFLRFPI